MRGRDYVRSRRVLRLELFDLLSMFLFPSNPRSTAFVLTPPLPTMASGSRNNGNKFAFLDMAPPANYVAGLGRGASGFTTRSDIGPARQGPDAATIAAARARRGEGPEDGDDGSGAGFGESSARGAGGGGGDSDDGEEEGRFDDRDPENETGLFAGGIYERDDEEADRIWDAVDDKMDERRRAHREARERAEQEKLRSERPKIQAQFADLKRGLANVSETEWASLPEAGNLTGKKRKRAEKREGRDTGRSYAVPDSVLLGARNQNISENSLSQEQMDGSASNTGGMTTSLTEIGEARNKIFSHNLDQAGTSTSLGGTSSTIDRTGYLSSLSSIPTQSRAEIGDIKKARALLDSVIKTNPSHAPGWIAAARLEEVAGKMAVARKVIAQGCQHCPKSEDVWLENARLNNRDNAKVVLAQATQALKGQSVKIWIKATELETDPESKKRVLRKSLEFLPSSVSLWKELVNLETDPGAARVLLSGAVEAIPSSESLWLALARLSPPDEARKVLNEARSKIPTSHAIWIAAGRLAEQTSETSSDATQRLLDGIMSKAVKGLSKAGAVLSRDQWMEEALRVDSEGSPMTAEAIIKATLDIGIDDDEDRRIIWVQDAEAAKDKGAIATARAIVAYTLRLFPDRANIWKFAIDLEKGIGDAAALDALLQQAVAAVPKAENIWLIYAKTKWESGDVPGARQVLIRAFERNLGSEEISLAAVKLESENGQPENARLLLERARGEVGSARVWIKSAVFERDIQRNKARALELVEEALTRHQKEEKLWLMRAQLVQSPEINADKATGIRAARDVLSKAVKACPQSVHLWIAASRLEESADLVIRARSILEKARLANPRNEHLWLESARVEERAGGTTSSASSNNTHHIGMTNAESRRILSRGLQECPTSGLLWSESIFSEARPTRKTRSADALKKTGDDARVLNAVAQLFWIEGKYEKCRQWFERMVSADPKWGDGYAWWYKFERELAVQAAQTQAQGQARSGAGAGGEDTTQDPPPIPAAAQARVQHVVDLVKANDVKYGEIWQQVHKSEQSIHEHWLPERQVLEAVASRLQVTS